LNLASRGQSEAVEVVDSGKMRESNFSNPITNKASVGITPALYDRRALDCTSTLPLINSLNNLAYLTTSSARIRDILTVDGGVDRLVCLLKQGRSKDTMEMWKWNLAFQCLVNIGVRGSEAVRTRVVESDLTPVIATILDNYIRVVEKCREKDELHYRTSTRHASLTQSHSVPPTGSTSRQFSDRHSTNQIPSFRSERHRRNHNGAATGDAVPSPHTVSTELHPIDALSRSQSYHETTLTTPSPSGTPFPTRPSISNMNHRQSTSDEMRGRSVTQASQSPDPSLATSPFNGNTSRLNGRPVQEMQRVPSMIPTLNSMDLNSQPVSPATPSTARVQDLQLDGGSSRQRPLVRHHLSVASATSWTESNQDPDDDLPDVLDDAVVSAAPVVEIDTDIAMQDDVEATDAAVDGSTTPVTITAVPSVSVADVDAFIRPLGPDIGDVVTNNPETTATSPAPTRQFDPVQPLPPINTVNSAPPVIRSPLDSYINRIPFLPVMLPSVPRDEDVIMALQLLAYISKYCNLRPYFQSTHLVPRLQLASELDHLDDLDLLHAGTIGKTAQNLENDWDNEYIIADSEEAFNIFPLIEKFTAKGLSVANHNPYVGAAQHSETMQYWACVVMRNLCRKDEARGGIRQCAYWKCGQWETYKRQFAKCRRCRRTKYCSKECQKGAWATHRFWCIPVDEADKNGNTVDGLEGVDKSLSDVAETRERMTRPQNDLNAVQHYDRHHHHHHHNHQQHHHHHNHHHLHQDHQDQQQRQRQRIHHQQHYRRQQQQEQHQQRQQQQEQQHQHQQQEQQQHLQEQEQRQNQHVSEQRETEETRR